MENKPSEETSSTPVLSGGPSQSAPFKLNYKRTFIIGFAFFGILLLWGIYNGTCPYFLTELFQKAMPNSDKLEVQYLVGIVMAMDNMAALIMLPIFGSWSDKTRTKLGKRMPFIIVGAICTAIVMPFLPLAVHNQSLPGLIVCMALIIFFMMSYRSPAVALMPDITPKPLRSRANGIINIAGYVGGGIASILLGVIPFFNVTTYINATTPSLWSIELPYLIAAGLMLVSTAVLVWKIKENKLEQELGPELKRGEEVADIEDKITDDDAPLSKANKRMLILILAAEVLWFMSYNSVETFIGNYCVYYLGCRSGVSQTITLVGGGCSIVAFLLGGRLADRIGRKWTIVIGLSLCVIAWGIMCFVGPTNDQAVLYEGVHYNSLPIAFWFIWIIQYVGWALINICSFPMVVELSSKKKIGKFTGLYYSASMLAQSITPILIGLIFKIAYASFGADSWRALPIYAGICMAISLGIFFFVKNVNNHKVDNKKGLEALGADD